MFVWACKYKKTWLWAYLLICEGVFEHSSSFSSFSSVCFSDLKCDEWINVLIHVWACKYKKACQWAELLICEGVFEYSSSFSSFSLLFFSDFKTDKKMLWFKNANIRKHVSEQSYSSVRVFLSILAHFAHLAHFLLIFYWINTYFDGSM